MTVAVDATSSADVIFTGVTTITLATLAVTAAATALQCNLVFSNNTGVALPTGLTVTWAAQSLSIVSGADTGLQTGISHDDRTVIFGRPSPTSGTQNLVATWTNATSGYIDAMSWKGTDTTTPFKNGVSATGNATTPTINVTSPSGDFATGCLGLEGDSASTMSGTTLHTDNLGSTGNYGANYTTGVGTTTLSSTLVANTANWGYAACDVQVPIGGAPRPLNTGLHFELPSVRSAPEIDRTWSWSQTRMLGQDKVPNRRSMQSFDLPSVRPAPETDRSWTWRQVDKLGKDRLPNRQQDWPNPVPPPNIDHGWSWRQVDKLGKDSFPNLRSMKSFDLPPGPPPPEIDRTWVWNQTRMFGQDKLPNRQQDWPNPAAPPRIDQTWTSAFRAPVTVTLPFNQYDWPNPQPPPRTTIQNFYRVLISGVAQAPFNQFDWPNPVAPPAIYQSWTWRQTYMLGQDKLPLRQQDWPVPPPLPQIDRTWLQGFNTSLASIVIYPPFYWHWPNPPPLPWANVSSQGINPNLFSIQITLPRNQYIWPIPTAPPQIDLSWSWSQTRLLGQDTLPFRQQDWQLPPPLPNIDHSWAPFNLALATFVAPPQPHHQYDWPNPRPIPPPLIQNLSRTYTSPQPVIITTPFEWIIRARRRGRR